MKRRCTRCCLIILDQSIYLDVIIYMNETTKMLLIKRIFLKYYTAFHALEKSEKLGVMIILCLALMAPFVEYAGWDFFKAFRRETLSGVYGNRTWNPYPLYWLLYPFAVLPPRVGFFLWNLFSAICVLVAVKKFNGRFLPFSLSLPVFWLFFIGQLEGVMSLGLVLIMATSPWVVGLGITILTLKPQIGLFPILYVLINRRDWRILVVPSIIYGLSFLHWGFWIPNWLNTILVSDTTNYPTNVSLWPYSVILLLILFWQRKNLKIWLVIQSLVVPYFAVYSLAPLFTMHLPLWVNILLWLLYGSAVFIRFPVPGFIVPLSILIVLLVVAFKSRQQKKAIIVET